MSRFTVIQDILCNVHRCFNMAFIHLKFERIFYILRIFGTFTNTWPARPDIERNEILLRDLYYYFAIFILMTVWIPMIIKTYKCRNDIGILMKNLSHIAALTEAIFNSILCRIKRKQLQVNVYTYIIYICTYACMCMCLYVRACVSVLHRRVCGCAHVCVFFTRIYYLFLKNITRYLN